MAVDPYILIANPGSASRKYALYKKGNEVAHIHVEFVASKLVAHIATANKKYDTALNATLLDAVFPEIIAIISSITNNEQVAAVGLRIVAPSGYFMRNMVLDNEAIRKLEQLHALSPLHISATLQELKQLKQYANSTPIIGVSDSAFHITKPDYVWNYGINLDTADKYDIKRFGYHGLSLQSAVAQLKKHKTGVPERLVICHLGSGSSVSALLNGKSVDTTMGYSPLEGLIMATRSGSIDFGAGLALAAVTNKSPDNILEELNKQSGLLGISGYSSDIRSLVEAEASGHHRASLALSMYVYTIRQAIAKMTASLEGIDALVFTGTVGQRSVIIRQRIMNGLQFLGLAINQNQNSKVTNPNVITSLHPRTRNKPVLVVPAQEESAMAEATKKVLQTL